MNRLGLLYPQELSAEAKELYDEFDQFTASNYGDTFYGAIYKVRDGRYVGPFGAELHTPGVGKHFLGMGAALASISGLSPLHREIAIITTGAHFGAEYQLHAHKRAAINVGLSTTEYDKILRGEQPHTLDEAGKAVYDAAHWLLHNRGPLADSAWVNMTRLLGRDGATAVVQYVAFYSYVCVVLNGFDCKIPNPEATDPEQPLDKAESVG